MENAENNQSSPVFADLTVRECLNKQRELLEQYNQLVMDFQYFEDERMAQASHELNEVSEAATEFENILRAASGYDARGVLRNPGTTYLPENTGLNNLSPVSEYKVLLNEAREFLQTISAPKKTSDPRQKWAIAAVIGSIPLFCFIFPLFSQMIGSAAIRENSFLLSIAKLLSYAICILPALLFVGGLVGLIVVNAKPNTERLQSIANLAGLRSKAKYLENKWREQIDTNAEQIIEEKKLQLEGSSDIIRNQLDEINQMLQPYMDNMLETSAWDNWKPATDITPVIRFGEAYLLGPIGDKEMFKVPALLPFPESLNMLFLAKDLGKMMAASTIQTLALRILASVPPGKAKFTFIDPIGLGQNAAEFMLLSDYDDSLVTGKVWTSPEHIQQRLSDLSEHIENVIQKYLRNQYATIEEYNTQAGEIAEPYRFLVIFDFPANFDDDSARHLAAIAQNGPRCGVYTMVMVDLEKQLPHSFNPQDLERASVSLAWDERKFLWNDEAFFPHSFAMDYGMLDPELTNRILTEVGEATKDTNKIEVPLEKLFEIFNKQVSKFTKDFPGINAAINIHEPDTWWLGISEDSLVVPLGRLGAEKAQCMTLGKGTSQHVLIAGKTGSGKSSLLHVLITSTALIYSPGEVELYLIDFKKGVEFKPYVSYQLPHARVIAVESEREFGLSVLQGLNEQLSARGDMFRAMGVQNLSDYRSQAKSSLSRILLLVDEFQEFFTEDDAIATQASQILDRLVRQGRAFGIHVILGSQTLAGAYSLARSTIDQMAVRIALQCSETDSRLILSDDNPAARLLTRPGEAIYNDENGKIEGNNRFQVAWLPDGERDKLLVKCLEHARRVQYTSAHTPIYFEGNALAEIETNQFLVAQLKAYPPKEDYLAMKTWVGDPIAIQDPLAITFHRQSGGNLLIVGQSDDTVYGILTAQVLSVAAQMKRDLEKNIYILDFSAGDSRFANHFSSLQKQIGYPLEIGRRRQLSEILNQLSVETKNRVEADKVNLPPKFLFLVGIQRARDIRPSDPYSFSLSNSDSSEAQVDFAQLLTTILRDGPEVGIHTVIWCDSYTNLGRSLERQTQRELAMRVVLQMSAEDSSSLIDSTVASKLGAYRAIFSSEDEGRLEKFRPYLIPSQEWLEWVCNKLAN